MRVGMFAADGEESACTRYRLLQHVPRLRARLGHVDVLLHADVSPRSRRVRHRGAFAAQSVARYLAEGVRVRLQVGRYEALFVQRGLYPLGPGTIARSIESFDGRVVFDLDDAVHLGSPALAARPLHVRWLYGPHQALRLLRRADAIVVSTPGLAEILPSWVRQPVVLATVPDPRSYPMATHTEGVPVRIGWAGTMRNLHYLELVRSPVERLRREAVAGLEVVSSTSWDGPSTFRRWTLGEESSVFSRFSIGIMPLPDTPYTRAKAGFKLLQYMAAGVPVVASPVGVNQLLVEASGAGFLASSPSEWEEALRLLALDPSLRSELGSKGRAFVERYADLDTQAETLSALLLGRSS